MQGSVPIHVHASTPHSLPSEESNVEDGCVEVDKLEDVEFGDEAVFVLCLCAVEFCEEGGEGKGRRGGEGRGEWAAGRRVVRGEEGVREGW